MQRSFSRQFHISVRNSIQSSKPLSNSTPLKGTELKNENELSRDIKYK